MLRHIPDFLSEYKNEPVIDAVFDSFVDDLFRLMWHTNGVCKVFLPRARNYTHEIADPSLVDDVSHSVWIRRMVFGNALISLCRRSFKKISTSAMDFYIFFENNLASIMPNPDMCAFDRLFMACALVVEMGFCCSAQNNNTHIYAAPQCLSLYFDTHLRKDFYDEGGWKLLSKYAARHKNCRLLSYYNVSFSCKSKSDLLNVLTLIEKARDDCDLSEILEAFMGICLEYDEQEMLTCRRCLPLFLALKIKTTPSTEGCNQLLLTEGFLQFALRTLSTFEICTNIEVFRDRLKAIMEGRAFDPDHDLSQEIPPESSREFEDLVYERVTQTSTDCVIRNLFLDDLNTTIDSDDSIETIERCIFCTQRINWIELLPRQFAIVKNLETISATIESKLDYVPNPGPELGKFSHKEVADACFKAYCEKFDKYCDVTLDSIRLFLSLGHEPQKTEQVQDRINQTWFDVSELVRTYLNMDKTQAPKPKKKSHKKTKNKATAAEAGNQK